MKPTASAPVAGRVKAAAADPVKRVIDNLAKRGAAKPQNQHEPLPPAPTKRMVASPTTVRGLQ